MRLIILMLALIMAVPARAQDAESARICPLQLTSAENDAAGLLRSLHTTGAQRDLLRNDLMVLQQENTKLKKQIDELKKPVEDKPQ